MDARDNAVFSGGVTNAEDSIHGTRLPAFAPDAETATHRGREIVGPDAAGVNAGRARTPVSLLDTSNVIRCSTRGICEFGPAPVRCTLISVLHDQSHVEEELTMAGVMKCLSLVLLCLFSVPARFF